MGSRIPKERGASEMRELFDSMRDSRPTITRCFLPPCRGGVICEGTAAEGREAAKLHREEKHPGHVQHHRRLTQEQQRDRAMARSEWRRRRLKGED